MKKIYRILIIVFILLTTTSALTDPFISTKPCARVEYFQVSIEDNETKEKFSNIVLPQPDDSLIADLLNDLTISSKNADLKITITATNSDGDSSITSFNLKISTENDITNYKIEPIPEPDNPSYLEKYVTDQLEVEIKEDGNNDDDRNNGGCFISTTLK